MAIKASLRRNIEEQREVALSDVINRFLFKNQSYINTALPAKIVSYDSKNQTCTASINIKNSFEFSEENINYPEIPNVPIIHTRTERAFIHVPVKIGDNCLLIFLQRDIEKYKETGKVDRPDSKRMHDLNDAVAIMGFWDKQRPFIISEGEETSLLVKNESSFLEIKKNGVVRTKNKNGEINISDEGKISLKTENEDLLNILLDLLDAIPTFTTTIGGRLTPSYAKITSLRKRVEKIQDPKKNGVVERPLTTPNIGETYLQDVEIPNLLFNAFIDIRDITNSMKLLVTALSSLVTVGSPATQTISPTTITALQNAITRLPLNSNILTNTEGSSEIKRRKE